MLSFGDGVGKGENLRGWGRDRAKHARMGKNYLLWGGWERDYLPKSLSDLHFKLQLPTTEYKNINKKITNCS